MAFTTVDDNYFITDDDATLYRAIQFAKNAIFDFIYVYPNIIENNVDYDSIQIPKHWNLSMNHTLDVKNIISNIYRSSAGGAVSLTFSPMHVYPKKLPEGAM